MAVAEIIVIPADLGQPVRLESVEPTLSKAKELVGGWVDDIKVGNWAFLCDEEGSFKDYEANVRATRLLFGLLRSGEVLVSVGPRGLLGDVVLVGIKGPDWVSVPEGLWDKVNAV